MNMQLETSAAPTLMLLPEGAVRTQPRCASLGRPVELEVLKQDVARMLRQPKPLIWEGIGRFDPVAMTLTAILPSMPVTLTEKEAALLAFLARCRELATREALLENVWRYHPDTETHTLETHLYRLRQKLREAFGEQLRIHSDDSGYRLIAG
jgi:DNA-binding response OmpR family regulator